MTNIDKWTADKWEKTLKHACEMDEWREQGIKVPQLPKYTPPNEQKWGKVMTYSFIKGLLP